jgi:hypothetical protein
MSGWTSSMARIKVLLLLAIQSLSTNERKFGQTKAPETRQSTPVRITIGKAVASRVVVGI